MQPVFLSDIELYYSEKVSNDLIEIVGDECHHIVDVMRHKTGDELYVTDGRGAIYLSMIEKLSKKKIDCRVIKAMRYENKLGKITFCLPRMKNSERFEFALEKSVELGITNFVVFESNRTVAKGEKLYRWQKVLLSAMKQSLRAWLPKISYAKNLNSILDHQATKILLDQNANELLTEWVKSNDKSLLTNNHYFIFGPEGGFEKDELKIENEELRIRLTENRLRSETAIIAAASILAAQL